MKTFKQFITEIEQIIKPSKKPAHSKAFSQSWQKNTKGVKHAKFSSADLEAAMNNAEVKVQEVPSNFGSK